MTLKAREQYWRKTVQRRRRAEKRANDDPDTTHSQRQTIRESRRKAEAALAKVRQELAGGQAPTIVTAEQIGLGFTYPFGLKGPVYRGAGHYTAGHRAKNKAELIAEMRSDHRFHAGKGWGGLSYEYMVADDGTLGLGSPTNRKAAAVAVNNTGMVGICCPGTTGDRMTDAQKRTIRWLLANAHTAKLPKAHRLPRSARGLTWKPHKRWPSQSTACPGAMEPDYLEVWR